MPRTHITFKEIKRGGTVVLVWNRKPRSFNSISALVQELNGELQTADVVLSRKVQALLQLPTKFLTQGSVIVDGTDQKEAAP